MGRGAELVGDLGCDLAYREEALARVVILPRVCHTYSVPRSAFPQNPLVGPRDPSLSTKSV